MEELKAAGSLGETASEAHPHFAMLKTSWRRISYTSRKAV